MNPQIANPLDIMVKVAVSSPCGITGRMDCHCKVVTCKCGKSSPLCRTIGRVESETINDYVLFKGMCYTGECCLGGSIEEWNEEFYRTHPAF